MAEEASPVDGPARPNDEDPLLAVENLSTHIHTDRGTIRASDGVSFTIHGGETVGLVGESGSGKSVTAESITGIVPQPPAELVDGSITFDGTSLTHVGTADDGRASDDSQLRTLRGDRIAHIFQNPQHALDPVYTVGEQIVEAITIHRDVERGTARARAIDLLRRVGIPNASARVDDYPHEFSGGMCQRAAIAIALASDPDVLIADEPTTAVDVTVQARLIDLFRELTDTGMALLYISHDLRVVATLADRVLVMYGGTIVESGPTRAVFERPAHPYTRALFASYDGDLPETSNLARRDVPTDGCRYRMGCPHAIDACAGGDRPPRYPVADSSAPDAAAHRVSCVYYDPDREESLSNQPPTTPLSTEETDD